MKLHDLLVANALIKLSPFIVGGALLFGLAQCGSKAPDPSAPMGSPCAEAAAAYNRVLNRGAWVAQEILCRNYDSESNPAVDDQDCLNAAYAYVKGMAGSGDAMEANCKVSTAY
jgi:hypothetical protein